MAPLVQVALSVRKAAAASFTFSRIAGGDATAKLSPSDRAQLESLAGAALGRLAMATQSGENLDTFLSEHADAIRTMAPGLLTPGLSRDGEKMLDGALAAIEGPHCAKCPGRSATGNPVCSDIPLDDATIAAGAACLSEITEAMGFVHRLAENLLADAFGRPHSLNLRLQTKFKDEYKISGACAHDDGAVAADIIEFFLPALGFQYAELATTPYVLAHEIICHALQGTEGFDGTARRACGPSCSWTEGWMDCVAAEAIADALIGPGQSVPPWMREEDGGIVFATELAHLARLASTTTKTFADLRGQAFRAWRMFEQPALSVCGDEIRAKLLRQKFSIIYNAAARSPAERQRVGVELGVRLSAGTPEGQEQIVKAAAKLVETGDVEIFLQTAW